MEDFPALHVRPPSGWLNDPNGPFRWRGRYHLFFQHNPAAPVHGAICWGHATSADLVTWTTEPLALRPDPGGPDAGGCWSGCVVDDAGVPTAVYTGLATADQTSATILLATAEDDGLRTWRKEPVPVAGPPAGSRVSVLRDPFVFHHAGRRYAVVGAGEEQGRGVVLLYGCDDLRRWEYLGPLVEAADAADASGLVAEAEIWECPQLFRLGDRWVLLLSLVAGGAITRAAYLTGDLVPGARGPRFVPDRAGLADHGHDFYAPAVLVEPDRVLVWGWTWEDRPLAEVVRAGWAGALTWPRVPAPSATGALTWAPASELERLRTGIVRGELAGGHALALPEGPVDVEVAVEPDRGPVVLRLRGGGAGLELALDPDGGQCALSREVHDPAHSGWDTRAPVPVEGGEVRVRLVLDGSVVEVFVAGGPCYTERLYPDGPWELALVGAPGVGGRVAAHPLAAPGEPPG